MLAGVDYLQCLEEADNSLDNFPANARYIVGMKRGLILLTGLFLLSSSAWAAGTLKVTTPNGGQKWTTGKTYQIKWSKGNA